MIENPVTLTHQRINKICNSLDLNCLKTFCLTQFQRIQEITSNITVENKCTPKMWTGILGTNHKYLGTFDYNTSGNSLFRVSEMNGLRQPSLQKY